MMGYCPRCGDHSTFDLATTPEDSHPVRSVIKIAADSRIVTLPVGLEEGAVVTYGGARFTVSFEGDQLVLDAAD